MVSPSDSTAERHRLDKWLWCTRFYKSRALATDAVAGGRVKVNGERVKASHALRLGDRLNLSQGNDALEIEVLAFPARRGPATEAQACYQETPESSARRVIAREQRRIANLSHAPADTRPDKRERRQLERFWRDQNE